MRSPLLTLTTDFGLSDGSVFHLLANDAGLLPQPKQVTSLMVPPGARAELLLNFSARTIGSAVTLRSLDFASSGMGGMGGMTMGGPTQGTPMDILKIYVDHDGRRVTTPSTLASSQPYNPANARRTRYGRR